MRQFQTPDFTEMLISETGGAYVAHRCGQELQNKVQSEVKGPTEEVCFWTINNLVWNEIYHGII